MSGQQKSSSNASFASESETWMMFGRVREEKQGYTVRQCERFCNIWLSLSIAVHFSAAFPMINLLISDLANF